MNAMDDPNYGDEFHVNGNLVSECCGAHEIGELYDADPKHNIPATGLCSQCREWAGFVPEIEEE
jgi:hypothetical protein